jgi:hypothetical protein
MSSSPDGGGGIRLLCRRSVDAIARKLSAIFSALRFFFLSRHILKPFY